SGGASAAAGAAASTATPRPSAAAAPASAAIKRGYIQIGIFSQEANAKRAADQMTAAGMAAAVRSDQSNGKTYWRVIVGPSASVAERDALVARVKGIGYPDAYPVSN
ncbi:SPOR domain-containing protein, partial [Albidovulum sp.]|uniref:SPOR domain-containing protein n=1 Tax=Albidovulum sp. TaxID=1872424 RepID=UPI0039B8BD22